MGLDAPVNPDPNRPCAVCWKSPTNPVIVDGRRTPLCDLCAAEAKEIQGARKGTIVVQRARREPRFEKLGYARAMLVNQIMCCQEYQFSKYGYVQWAIEAIDEFFADVPLEDRPAHDGRYPVKSQ